jgi:hypothetical protein
MRASDRQRAAIFAMGKDIGLTRRELTELVEYITGKTVGTLTDLEARDALNALKGAAAFIVLRFHLRDVNR